MKIVRWIWIVLAMLALALPVLAQDTTDESNQDRNAAPSEAKLTLTNLADGATVTDTLSDDVQARLYTFHGEAGDTVTITMTQLTEELDPYVVLLGPAGEVIAADDDGGEVALSSRIQEAVLPVTGNYFIMATSYIYIDAILMFESEVEVMEYELTLSGNSANPEEADSIRYFAGQLVMGESQIGYSTAQQPVFYYTFEGQAGEVITINIAEADFDTILHLFSPTGERIAVNDDFDDSLNARIDAFELPADGLYLVFATDVFFYNAVSMGEDVLEYYGGQFEIELFEDMGDV